MAGPGRAVPEGTRSLTCRRKDIGYYVYWFSRDLLFDLLLLWFWLMVMVLMR